MTASLTPQEIVDRCEKLMAHAWMVRTFIKHCEEADEYPELMGIVRAVFDTSRALETRIDDPSAYLKMLQKKIGTLRKATEQFRIDTEEASTHMNFKQAVVSMDACIEGLDTLIEASLTTPQG